MIGPVPRSAILSAVAKGDMAAAAAAAAKFQQATGSFEGFFLFASALLDQGKVALAERYFALLREAVPKDPEIAFAFGLALQRGGKLDAALPQWTAALDLAPRHLGSCRNLAMGLLDTGRDEAASIVLRRLLVLLPEDADAQLHLGNIRYRQKDYAGAIGFYRRALAAAPSRADAWACLGEALHHRGDLAAAEAAFHQAVALDADCRQAHFNLACLLLRQARWQEGFHEYQWRANLRAIPAGLAAVPQWHRQAPGGARVGLWNDQGLGDALLFLRYARRLKARGFSIVLILPKPLLRLVRTVDWVDEVCDWQGAIPALDYQAPLPSLPHLLDEPVPGGAAAYVPSPGAVSAASPRLAVGLVWAANPDSPNGAERSIPLTALAPLRTLPGIDWYSLQVGAAAGQIAAAGWTDRLADLGSTFGDFFDTAAAIARLDLVISVDTSVVHLAGALGKPVWVLLTRPADWRWQAEGTNSPWYPSATLFRQGPDREWDAIVAELASALSAFRKD